MFFFSHTCAKRTIMIFHYRGLSNHHSFVYIIYIRFVCLYNIYYVHICLEGDPRLSPWNTTSRNESIHRF